MNDSYQVQIDAFQHKILEQIPLTRAMGFERIDYDGRDLAFELSLEPNHNDKGTAFAGALSAAANLCGWGAITLLLEAVTQANSKPYDVVIRDSRLEYMLAERQAICSRAVDAFVARLKQRGKARLDLTVEVVERGKPCFRFSGSYVALEKKQWC